MIKSSARSAQQAQDSFAEVLGSMPALWTRLIDEHRPDLVPFVVVVQ